MTLENLLQKDKHQLAEEMLEMYHELQHKKLELDELKRMVFGTKSERFISTNPHQQVLFDDSKFSETGSETEAIHYTRRKVADKKAGHGRNLLPDHLPRVDHIIEPEEDVSGLVQIGELISEELEYKPAELYVNRYIRPKYAKADGEGVLVGFLPNRPIEKGIPGPGLLAHILTGKYVDHQPLYRQRQIFKRHQVDIAPSSIDGWVARSFDVLIPVYERYRLRLQAKDYLQVDETPVRVQDPSVKGKTHTGYFWVYYSPPDQEVFFDYHPSRGRKGTAAFFEKFRGSLQTDGWKVYEYFGAREDITALHCMAHARRYFEKAAESPETRNEALSRIAQLYHIEEDLRKKELCPDEIRELRMKHSLPLLQEMKSWLDEQLTKHLPKSRMGIAVAYMLSQWEGLIRYCDDGRYQIDNNWVENKIRPVALGRKNWLFAGSHIGAQRSALFYTLTSNAKLAGLDPYRYLKKLISRIPDHPMNKLDELLAHNIILKDI